MKIYLSKSNNGNNAIIDHVRNMITRAGHTCVEHIPGNTYDPSLITECDAVIVCPINFNYYNCLPGIADDHLAVGRGQYTQVKENNRSKWMYVFHKDGLFEIDDVEQYDVDDWKYKHGYLLYDKTEKMEDRYGKDLFIPFDPSPKSVQTEVVNKVTPNRKLLY